MRATSARRRRHDVNPHLDDDAVAAFVGRDDVAFVRDFSSVRATSRSRATLGASRHIRSRRSVTETTRTGDDDEPSTTATNGTAMKTRPFRR